MTISSRLTNLGTGARSPSSAGRRGRSLFTQPEMPGVATTEPLQNLASRLRQPIPTDPLSVAALGGNVDQQKMAGTPNQLQGAQAASEGAAPQPVQPGETSLSTFLRRGQPANTAAMAYQALQNRQKIQQTSDLSNIDLRVGHLINAQLSRMANVLPSIADPANVAGLATGPVNYSLLKLDLEGLRADPSNAKLLAAVNTRLGRGPDTLLSPEQIKQLYGEAVEAITTGVAGSVDTDITVSDLVNVPEFGYTLPELAAVLGVSSDELAGYSIEDLSNAVGKLNAKSSEATAAQTSSSLLGGAEQRAYGELGREQAVSGVRATEEQLSEIERQVSEGQIVKFAGQEFTVEQLLEDGELTNLVSEYVTQGRDSPIGKTLQKEEPELAAWLDRNIAALGDLITTAQGTATQLDATQKAVGALATVGNTTLSDSVMRSLIPTWGSIQTSNIDTPALLATIQKLPPAEATQVGVALNALAQVAPDELANVQKLSPEEIRQLPTAITKYTELQKQYAQIQSLRPDNPNGIIQTLTGIPELTVEDAQAQLTRDTTSARWGLGTSGLGGVIDRNGDGVIDNVDNLLPSLSNLPKPSISDAIAGRNLYTPPTAVDLKSPKYSDDPNMQMAAEKIFSKMQPGQQLPTAENIVNSGLTDAEYTAILTNPRMRTNMGMAAWDAVNTNAFASTLSSEAYALPEIDRTLQATVGELTPEMTAIYRNTISTLDERIANVTKLLNGKYISPLMSRLGKLKYMRAQLIAKHAGKTTEPIAAAPAKSSGRAAPGVNRIGQMAIPTVEEIN